MRPSPETSPAVTAGRRRASASPPAQDALGGDVDAGRPPMSLVTTTIAPVRGSTSSVSASCGAVGVAQVDPRRGDAGAPGRRLGEAIDRDVRPLSEVVADVTDVEGAAADRDVLPVDRLGAADRAPRAAKRPRRSSASTRGTSPESLCAHSVPDRDSASPESSVAAGASTVPDLANRQGPHNAGAAGRGAGAGASAGGRGASRVRRRRSGPAAPGESTRPHNAARRDARCTNATWSARARLSPHSRRFRRLARRAWVGSAGRGARLPRGTR